MPKGTSVPSLDDLDDEQLRNLLWHVRHEAFIFVGHSACICVDEERKERTGACVAILATTRQLPPNPYDQPEWQWLWDAVHQQDAKTPLDRLSDDWDRRFGFKNEERHQAEVRAMIVAACEARGLELPEAD